MRRKTNQKVVCVRVAQLVWDCHVSPNLHTLAIYLKLVHVLETRFERFDECECECEDDDIHVFRKILVLGDEHYRWLKGPINLLSMEQRAKYFVRTTRRLIEFLQL